jgi:DNA polymerase-1
MYVICDIETDRLHEPTKVHCIVVREVQSGLVHKFTDLEEFRKFSPLVSVWIGHNFLGFDIHILNGPLVGLRIRPDQVIDTLVVSRLLEYTREGGHSLESWGEFFGIPKVGLQVDFSVFSEELLERCVTDTLINLKLYRYQEKYLFSNQFKKALRLEHDISYLCHEIHSNGFFFDQKNAKVLEDTLDRTLEELFKSFLSAFPKQSKLIREVTPKVTKHGTLNQTDFRWLPQVDGIRDLSAFYPGSSFSIFEWEEFNPSSKKQVIDRLWDAGWKPINRTDGAKHFFKERGNSPINQEKADRFKRYGWKTDEDNLATLPEDAPQAARKLVQWLLLSSRRRVLQTWENAFCEADSKIHAQFHHIGAWTHRMAHSDPNMGNVPSLKKSKYKGKDLEALSKHYGTEMRKLWCASPGRILIGTDASGIQSVVLAHYLEDEDFTKALLEGDIHAFNWEKLGKHICHSRADAKTFYYAFIMGGQIPATQVALKCSREEAREALDNFVRDTPGLKRLKEEQIPKDAAKGFFEGLDGRLVLADSEHKMIAGYLQNGESVLMKWATRLWHQRLRKEKIPFWLVNYVHDEWQTETLDERYNNDLTLAQYIGKVQVESLEQTGRELGLRCPLTGESAIGYNWFETH